ncbi:MAG: hypothetical protein CL536_01690 [Alcaligenaceae bacterium]|nr:hypothetical protein [Alcaligenaceae bacterium]
MARNWKRVRPNSLLDAFRLAKDYARERRQLSVERIAELMATSPDSLYKWLGTGRMPAVMIPVYENVCGVHFVSGWLAASSGKIVIDMPAGKTPSTESVQELQERLHKAVGELMLFYKDDAAIEPTLAATQAGLEGLAWHHLNIQQQATPQLDFGVDDE